jgi:hypothetical protein
MIKNWLVKTKQIKKKKSGFQSHVNYLINENKASHSGTTIHVLNDSSQNILNEIDNRKLHRQEQGLRGGGVSNYATSFVISLPVDIKQANPEEWKQIGLYGIKKIAQKINVDYKDLKNISHIVLHEEENKPSHIHVLVGNVLNNEVIKGVSQFKATHELKKSVNYSVKKLLNEDNNDYIPKSKNKNLPGWLVKSLKAEKIMNDFKDFKDSINKWFDNLTNKKNVYLASKKAALDFDKFDVDIGDKLPEKILNEIESIEEMPEMPEHEKVTPKTKRKRRRRTKKDKDKKIA